MSTNPNSLSNYFSNDPPSLFDQLDSDLLNPTPFEIDNVILQPTDYFAIDSHEKKVPEEVKNIWQFYQNTDIPPTKLTYPTISLTTDLPDQIHDLVITLLGEDEASKRRGNNSLRIEEVTRDDRGLRLLIEQGYCRAAVNLTGHLLSNYGCNSAGQSTKNTPHSLQLWFTRLALLLKMGLNELVQTESEAFGMLNRPDMFYEFYPDMYQEKRGSMASFSFRLLLADLPQFLNKPRQSIDRLAYLNSITEQICQHYESVGFEDAKVFWRSRQRRVFHSIVNASLMAKDYGLVDTIMGKVANNPTLTPEEKYEYFSCWGRICLQIGDVFGAEKKFLVARKIQSTNSERELIDRGLVAVAQNDFTEAYNFFQKAQQLNPNSIVLLNNMCVCLLYSGKLKESIKLYESALDKNIKMAMNSEFLINLATLYELETTDANTKKLDLLKKIGLNVVDVNINLLNCLKLQSINVPC